MVEVGVHHRPRAAGESKVSLWDIPRTLSMLLPFWWSRVLFPVKKANTERLVRWNTAGMMIVALVAALLLFLNLSYPLVKPDEHRYAEISREMLTSGDWIVPRFDQQPYLDKPPLYYWLTCVSYRLFGVTEQAARYVPALSAFLTILATYVFGARTLGNRAGFLAALALSLTTGFIQCGRFIILDSLFTLLTALALFTGYEAIRRTRLSWKWLVASAICCALGVLTKGPAAFVLVVPPMFAYLWLNQRVDRSLLRPLLAYASIVVALVAPWYIVMTLRIPDFAYYFFVEHNLLRFMTGRFHEAPIWFYLPVLLIGGLPWSLLGLPLAKYLFARSPQLSNLRTQALGFPLLWAAWCFIFFSLSRGKLPPYILPALPALALMVGSYLNHMLSQASLRTLFHEEANRTPRQFVTLFASAWVFVALFCWWRSLVSTTECLMEIGVCAGCLVAVHLWGRRVPTKLAWSLSCLVVAAVIYECSHELIPDWSRQRSPLAQTDVYGSLLQDPTVGVAAYGHEWCTLPLQEQCNDIFNFVHKAPPELQKYLSLHERNLLVTKTTRDSHNLQWAVPAGMKIRCVADHGETRVFVIENSRNTANSPSTDTP